MSVGIERRKKMKTYLFGTVIVAALAAGAFGQSEVNARREIQQERIANGVKSGQLTARETANLEKKESNINKEIRVDRKQNGGNLTNNEKRQINRQQNNVSGQIHADKTNAATQKYGANEVDARRANQQNRIANGIASGKLNAGETAKLETKEAAVNRQVATERKANGGNLTNNQKRQTNAPQNNVSGQIYKDKTN
jgi:hypothetical protein